MRSFEIMQISTALKKENRGIFYSKRGSFIEATMVLPVTILIIFGLMALMLEYYQNFYHQVEARKIEIEEMYLEREMDTIRLFDRWVLYYQE